MASRNTRRTMSTPLAVARMQQCSQVMLQRVVIWTYTSVRQSANQVGSALIADLAVVKAAGSLHSVVSVEYKDPDVLAAATPVECQGQARRRESREDAHVQLSVDADRQVLLDSRRKKGIRLEKPDMVSDDRLPVVGHYYVLFPVVGSRMTDGDSSLGLGTVRRRGSNTFSLLMWSLFRRQTRNGLSLRLMSVSRRTAALASPFLAAANSGPVIPRFSIASRPSLIRRRLSCRWMRTSSLPCSRTSSFISCLVRAPSMRIASMVFS